MDYIQATILLGVIIIGCIFLFLKPKAATCVLIFFCFIDLTFFSRWFGYSRHFGRLPFYLAIILSINLLLHYLPRKVTLSEMESTNKIVIKFIGALLLTSAVSMIYNDQSIVTALYDLRYYFLLLILYLAIKLYKPLPMTEVGFIRLIVVFSLVQIPVTAIQHFLVTIGGIRLSSSALDMASGTFGSYSSLLFLQLIAIGLVLNYQLKRKTPVLLFNNYILVVLLTIPLLLSYSRSAMGFIIVLILLVLLISLWDSLITRNIPGFVKTLSLTVFLPITIFALFYFFFWQNHFDIEKQLNPRHVTEYFFRYPRPSIEARIAGSHGVMGRGRTISEAIRLALRSPMQFLFGSGSGSTSEASFLGTKGTFFQNYGPFAGIGRTQISKTIAEQGFIGMAILLVFFVALFRQVRRSYRVYESLMIKDMYTIILISITIIGFYSRVLASPITIFVLAYFIALIQSKAR